MASLSLDISPMNFAISFLENEVSAKCYLKSGCSEKLRFTSWSALDEEVVRRSRHSATSRLELIDKAKAGHLEI